ncbi:MAG: nucleotide exchange factor GrpE, partial [Rickettsiales bacterium]
AEGVDMTLRELIGNFEKHGITRIDPLGEKFDHNFHQAVSQVEDPEKEPGTILQVMQAGYTLKDRLLRPAMVVVSKRGDAEQKVDTQV